MTERLDKIEDALLKLDSVSFEKFCTQYLIKECPALEHSVQEYGRTKGVNAHKNGRPDIYFKLSNDKYLFVECTTQKDNTYAKLKKDLLGCFTLGVESANLSKIFLMYTGNIISPSEHKELMNIAEQKGTFLEIISIDTLKWKILNSFPSLGSSFLNLQIDSGQILTVEDYLKQVRLSQLSTGQDQLVVGRETELKEILEGIKAHDLIILSGSTGVGKSRIALESIKKWGVEKPSYKQKIILPKMGILGDDVNIYFENNSEYIVFIDDANRIEDLYQILLFSQSRGEKLKLILTVRDFAMDKIKETLERLNIIRFREFKINRLDSEVMNQILTNEGVTSRLCQEQIKRLVNGNPRLALMAAKTVMVTKDCSVLTDVSTIYEDFFRPHLESRKITEKELLALGILAAFKVIHLSDEKIHELIEQAFSISKNELWSSFNSLFDSKLIEFGDSEVRESVKIADQTLASYVFYTQFIKSKRLSFPNLIGYFFETDQGRIKDAIKPILEAYGFEKLKPQIVSLAEKARKKLEIGDRNVLRRFFQDFSFCQEEGILQFLNEELSSATPIELRKEYFIDKKQTRYFDKGFQYIHLAKRLNHSINHSILASELVLNYLEKRPVAFWDVVDYAKSSLYFHSEDYDNKYELQVNFFNELFNRYSSDNNNILYYELLKSISGKYLQILTSAIKPRALYDMYQPNRELVGDCADWSECRKELWNFVFTLLENDYEDFKKIFDEALDIQYHGDNIDSSLLKQECEFVIQLMEKNFHPENLSHSILALRYLKHLRKCNVKTKKFTSFTKKFVTRTFLHYKLLSKSDIRFRKKMRGLRTTHSDEEIEVLRVERYGHKVRNYSIKGFLELYASLYYIQKTEWNYIFKQNFENLLIGYSFKYPEAFIDLIREIFATQNPTHFYSDKIIDRLFEVLINREEILWQLINQYEYAKKGDWQLSYLLFLPEELITPVYFSQLLEVLEGIDNMEFPGYYLRCLEKYERVLQNEAFIKIFEKIAQLCSDKGAKFNSLSLFKNYSNKFRNNVSLLKTLYFLNNSGKSEDTNGDDFAVIFDFDNNFLNEYLDYYYPKDLRDITDRKPPIIDWDFVWEHEYSAKLLVNIFSHFSSRELVFPDSESEDIIKNVFGSREGTGKIEEFLLNILTKLPENEQYVKMVFKIVSEHLTGRRLHFFAVLFRLNSSFSLFEQLKKRPTMIITGGNDGMLSYNLQEKKLWEDIKKTLPGKMAFFKHRVFIDCYIKHIDQLLAHENNKSFWRDY